jgi:hypothetical protein
VSITEDQFRAIIYVKFHEHFEHIHALETLAGNALVAYKGFYSNTYEASLSLIFPRAFKSFNSVRRLCELASCEDAAVILRSLLNLVVVTRWIQLDLPRRADKYFAWYWVQMHLDVGKLKTPPEWLPVIEKNFDRVRPLFTYADAKGKSRLAKKWYEPEANSLYDLFEQAGLKDHYDTYGFLSGIEHSDATAYYGMLVDSKTPEGDTRLELQNDLFVPRYLVNAFRYFGEVFRICNDTMHLVASESLEAVLMAGMEFSQSPQ